MYRTIDAISSAMNTSGIGKGGPCCRSLRSRVTIVLAVEELSCKAGIGSIDGGGAGGGFEVSAHGGSAGSWTDGRRRVAMVGATCLSACLPMCVCAW